MAICLGLLLGLPILWASANPFELDGPASTRGPVDERVFRRLRQLGISPAHPCSDAVFVRRAFLDVIGTLPTAQETKNFLVDRNPDKRSRWIDRLLERDEFAEYWALKWCDLLRVKAEFPINLWPNAVQAYHRWIRDCLRENRPYDRFVRDMLTASGSNFRVPPVNFYRALQYREPAGIAQTVALTFMGTRIEKWPQTRQSDLTAFFSAVQFKKTTEWKEEIVFFDPSKTQAALSSRLQWTAKFPDGATIALSPDRDPREAFADWLIALGNPWFARNIVNRIWCWLLGRGIIHEPDDL